jgi:hypothetical protein
VPRVADRPLVVVRLRRPGLDGHLERELEIAAAAEDVRARLGAASRSRARRPGGTPFEPQGDDLLRLRSGRVSGVEAGTGEAVGSG